MYLGTCLSHALCRVCHMTWPNNSVSCESYLSPACVLRVTCSVSPLSVSCVLPYVPCLLPVIYVMYLTCSVVFVSCLSPAVCVLCHVCPVCHLSCMSCVSFLSPGLCCVCHLSYVTCHMYPMCHVSF